MPLCKYCLIQMKLVDPAYGQLKDVGVRSLSWRCPSCLGPFKLPGTGGRLP